jgi:hypothetical protein
MTCVNYNDAFHDIFTSSLHSGMAANQEQSVLAASMLPAYIPTK